MTFWARHRRIAVALIQAVLAALDVLSQLVPGASHLVVVMLPLTVLFLAAAGSLIHDESQRPAAPVVVIPLPVRPSPPDSEADGDTRTPLPAHHGGNPHGATVDELPFLVGPAVFCPPDSPRPARTSLRRGRPVTRPSLACLTSDHAGRRAAPKRVSSLSPEIRDSLGYLLAG